MAKRRREKRSKVQAQKKVTKRVNIFIGLLMLITAILWFMYPEQPRFEPLIVILEIILAIAVALNIFVKRWPLIWGAIATIVFLGGLYFIFSPATPSISPSEIHKL